MNRSCGFVILVRVVLASVVLPAVAASAACATQNADTKPATRAQTNAVSDARSAEGLLGDWRGSSLCLVKPSACHDEEALYHVKADKSGKLQVDADKIVDGKPVNMGTTDCRYDPAKKLLHCEWPQGILDLTLEGDRLEGSMLLPDKTKWREIKLARVKK